MLLGAGSELVGVPEPTIVDVVDATAVEVGSTVVVAPGGSDDTSVVVVAAVAVVEDACGGFVVVVAGSVVDVVLAGSVVVVVVEVVVAGSVVVVVVEVVVVVVVVATTGRQPLTSTANVPMSVRHCVVGPPSMETTREYESTVWNEASNGIVTVLSCGVSPC